MNSDWKIEFLWFMCSRLRGPPYINSQNETFFRFRFSWKEENANLKPRETRKNHVSRVLIAEKALNKIKSFHDWVSWRLLIKISSSLKSLKLVTQFINSPSFHCSTKISFSVIREKCGEAWEKIGWRATSLNWFARLFVYLLSRATLQLSVCLCKCYGSNFTFKTRIKRRKP